MLRPGRFEAFLWIAGLLCLGWCLYLGTSAVSSRREAAKIVAQQSTRHTSSEEREGALRTASFVSDEGEVIGQIEIPALKLTAPITAGYEPDSLRRGVGHIHGTAMPGGLGNVGLAGHRDTFFRPLRRAASKMEIHLSDRTGTYHYAIDSTEIVSPEQVRVLDVANRPELTLITCFPFDYVGPAPKRFIVHAHLLSAAPDPVATH